jgi:hypothetical protein
MNNVSYKFFKPENVKVKRLIFESAVDGPLINNAGQCDVAINNKLDIYIECEGPPYTDFSVYVWVDKNPIQTPSGNGKIEGTITSNGACVISKAYEWY